MKKWLLFIALFPMVAYGQKTASPVTDPSDTIKVKRLKANKPEESNGIKMGTAYDIWENISQTPQLSTLSKAIKESGLISTFRSNGPLTLFAPANTAFAKLPKGQMDRLMKRSHILDLSSLLTSQAIPGSLSIKDLTEQVDDNKGKLRLITLAGTVLIITKDGSNLVLTDETGHKAGIIAPDLGQHNGYIHVINTVLVPKQKVL